MYMGGSRTNWTNAAMQRQMLSYKKLPTAPTASCIPQGFSAITGFAGCPPSWSFPVPPDPAKEKGSDSRTTWVLLLLQLSGMRNFPQTTKCFVQCRVPLLLLDGHERILGRIKNTNHI